jgi:centrosomal protein CEP164
MAFVFLQLSNTRVNMAFVLDEEVDVDYVPTESETREHAEWLGMDLKKDGDLLWIAADALKSPLPKPWKPCQTDVGEIFFSNFDTGESVWDHPCDTKSRRLLAIEIKKKSGDQLTEDDESFLIADGRELPRLVKVASLIASAHDSGVVEVTAMSMGGNVLAATKLKSRDDSFKSVQRRLHNKAGTALKLVLLDGSMPDMADRRKPIRELLQLDLPLENTSSQQESRSKKAEGGSKQASKLQNFSQPLTLAPLKKPVRKFRWHSDVNTNTATLASERPAVAKTNAIQSAFNARDETSDIWKLPKLPMISAC